MNLSVTGARPGCDASAVLSFPKRPSVKCSAGTSTTTRRADSGVRTTSSPPSAVPPLRVPASYRPDDAAHRHHVAVTELGHLRDVGVDLASQGVTDGEQGVIGHELP